MAIKFMHEDPQYESAVDVVVYYYNNAENGEKLFLVASTTAEARGCYPVNRESLVGTNLVYLNNVMQHILPEPSELPEDALVLITNRALNAISLVCEDNRTK